MHVGSGAYHMTIPPWQNNGEIKLDRWIVGSKDTVADNNATIHQLNIIAVTCCQRGMVQWKATPPKGVFYLNNQLSKLTKNLRMQGNKTKFH